MSNRHILLHILTSLLLLLATTVVQAQPRYQINSYEKLNGRVTHVNRIVRDTQGMIWFSTNDGIYRYDGYEFQNFKSRSGDGVDMPSNNISYMYSSSEGGMWCGVSGRIFLFDTRSYRFIDVLSDYERRQGVKLSVSKLRPLPCGVTWLFTDDGRILALEDAHPRQSLHQIADQQQTDNVTVVCDARERSWVLINSKTMLYDRGRIATFPQAFRQIITTAKAVWLITADGQPYLFDEATRQLRPWKHQLLTGVVTGFSMLANGYVALHTATGLLLMSDDGSQVLPTSVSYPVQKVMDDGGGHLWILAQDGRLSMADMTCRHTEEIAGIRTQKCNIMRDKHGSVWFFTDNGGTYYSEAATPTALVRCANDELWGDISNTINDGQGGYWFIHDHHAYRLTFESPHYSPLPLQQQGQVRCVFADSRGRLFVSTRYDQAVTVFRSGQRVGWLAPDGSISSTFVSFGASIYSSWLAPDGTLWLGSKQDGLFRLRPRQDGSFQLSQYTKEHAALSDNEIYAFAPDPLCRLWIATQRGGLCCIADYRADTPRFVHAGNGLDGWKYGPDTHLHALLATKGKLLVGTTDGLFVADISGSSLSAITFSRHRREADRSSSLSSSNITDMLMTTDHRLFITTGDGGLNELLTADVAAPSLSFRHYNQTSGFPTDITHNLVEYDHGLWITAPNQLVELRLAKADTPRINHYLLRENPRFSSCRPLATGQGRWVFGSEGGAFVVDLKELKNSTFIPPLVITGASKQSSPIDPSLGQNDTIVLAPGERDLTVWFSALDYENTELVAYAYRMADDHPWQYIGHSHSVTFTQMRPGTYRMAIRSTNSDGSWCNNERTLTIIVTPTFWETPWAVVLMLLVVAAVVGIVVLTLLYIGRIKRQQRDTMEAYLALLSQGRQQEEATSAAAIPADAPASDALLHSGGAQVLRGGLVEEASTAPLPSDGVAARPDTVSPPHPSPEDEEMMRRVMTFIESHLADSDVTIDDMASAAAVSRSGLHRKVKHLVGASPMEFLREARIRKASQMLRTTTKPITEIAHECGFSDPKYFSKCFKASTNLTPTEVRKLEG